MKRLIVITVAIWLCCALAISFCPSASLAEEQKIEEIWYRWETFRKVAGMPFYAVSIWSSIREDEFLEKARAAGKEEPLIHPRQVVVQRREYLYSDGYSYMYKMGEPRIYLLCDGDIIMNDDVPLVELHEVWPDGVIPDGTLLVYDGEKKYVPLGIETWSDLYLNSTGWSSRIDAYTMIRDSTAIEELRDPYRDPFLDPRHAWSRMYRTIDNLLEYKLKSTGPMSAVQTETLYAEEISLVRKLWLVAEKQPDYSYRYYFVKRFNKKNPDYSEKNDLGSMEAAIDYMRGK